MDGGPIISELKITAIRGGIWTVGTAMIVQPLGILTTILLARLLGPVAFGSIALAMVLVQLCYLLVNLGMGQALVQTSIDQRRAAFQSFAVTILSGSLLCLFQAVFAEPLAIFLGNVTIAPILRWMSLMIFLEALTTVPFALMRKELMFGRVNLAILISELSYVFVAPILALIGMGVWSLVIGQLIRMVVKAILVWSFCQSLCWLVPKTWNWGELRQLLKYGLQSTANGLISYFHSNWDNWMVARLLGTIQLGYYSQAYRFSSRTLPNLSNTLSNLVLFPSYVQIQDDRERIERGYMKSLSVIFLIMVPVALGMIVLAPEVVQVLLGEKWIPMIPVLRIFSVLILTRPISAGVYSLFMALGVPGHNVKAGLVLVVVMVPMVFALIGYGIAGVATAVVISNIAASGYNIFQMNNTLPGTARKTLCASIPSVVAGLIMAAAVLICKEGIALSGSNTFSFITFLLMVGLGAATYIAVSLLTQRTLIGEIFQLCGSVLNLHRRL